MSTKDLTTTEYAILGLLAFGERSGYDLIKSAERSVGFIWRPAKRNVYNVLPRLVSYGYAARRDLRQADRPDKHLYRITPPGRAVLGEWLGQVEVAGPGSGDVFLLKIFFGDLTDPEVVARQLQSYRDHVAERAETYREIESRIAGDPRNYFRYLTLGYGIEQAETSFRWAETALKSLASQTRTETAPRSQAN